MSKSVATKTKSTLPSNTMTLESKYNSLVCEKAELKTASKDGENAIIFKMSTKDKTIEKSIVGTIEEPTKMVNVVVLESSTGEEEENEETVTEHPKNEKELIESLATQTRDCTKTATCNICQFHVSHTCYYEEGEYEICKVGSLYKCNTCQFSFIHAKHILKLEEGIVQRTYICYNCKLYAYHNCSDIANGDKEKLNYSEELQTGYVDHCICNNVFIHNKCGADRLKPAKKKVKYIQSYNFKFLYVAKYRIYPPLNDLFA